MAGECWRPFPGYEGIYEVSDMGRVRSLDRIVRGRNGFPRPVRGKLMTPCIGGGGYLHVGVRRDNKALSVVVHRAVLIAFVGPAPEGCEACHGPAGRLVNTLANLRWGTRMDNVQDKKLFGRTIEGEKNPHAKLRECDVIEILSTPGRHVDMAAKFSVSPELIGQIRNGKAWVHIPRQYAFGVEHDVRFKAWEGEQ